MKFAIVAAVLAVTALGGVAIAATTGANGDSVSAHSTVGSGGTPKKPKVVSNSFSYDVTGAPGQRAATATKFVATTVGLVQDGKGFPVCTAEMIDSVKSDSICPKGSEIGTGNLTALIGPDNDTSSATVITCKKDIHLYNTGRHTFAILGVGDPKDCASIGYIYPTLGSWSQQGKKLVMDLPVPENVQHPLPGVSGYFNHSETTYFNMVTGKGKKKHGYFMSVGCGKAKQRKFTWSVISAANPQGIVDKSSAGKC
jgi:hypothetical protein